MLLFIHGAGREGAPEGTFQYITCYSLSNPGMQGPVGRLWFQYITCYSLSMDAYVVMQDHIKFQYITCYSLSRSGEKTRDLADVSIHHMLLFIISDVDLYIVKNMFQYITCYSLSRSCTLLYTDGTGFNTSHVTLYQGLLLVLDILRLVSIHHMLLFIFSETTGLSKKASFNTSHVTLYRNVQNSADSGEIVSIHHMLLFIREHLQGSTGMVRVSIHHMLLFIRLRKNCISISSRFNTSHVTLYPW